MALEELGILTPDEQYEDPEELALEEEKDPEETKTEEAKRANGEKRDKARGIREKNRKTQLEELKHMSSYNYWNQLQRMFGMNEDL